MATTPAGIWKPAPSQLTQAISDLSSQLALLPLSVPTTLPTHPHGLAIFSHYLATSPSLSDYTPTWPVLRTLLQVLFRSPHTVPAPKRSDGAASQYIAPNLRPGIRKEHISRGESSFCVAFLGCVDRIMELWEELGHETGSTETKQDEEEIKVWIDAMTKATKERIEAANKLSTKPQGIGTAGSAAAKFKKPAARPGPSSVTTNPVTVPGPIASTSSSYPTTTTTTLMGNSMSSSSNNSGSNSASGSGSNATTSSAPTPTTTFTLPNSSSAPKTTEPAPTSPTNKTTTTPAAPKVLTWASPLPAQCVLLLPPTVLPSRHSDSSCLITPQLLSFTTKSCESNSSSKLPSPPPIFAPATPPLFAPPTPPLSLPVSNSNGAATLPYSRQPLHHHQHHQSSAPQQPSTINPLSLSTSTKRPHSAEGSSLSELSENDDEDEDEEDQLISDDDDDVDMAGEDGEQWPEDRSGDLLMSSPGAAISGTNGKNGGGEKGKGKATTNGNGAHRNGTGPTTAGTPTSSTSYSTLAPHSAPSTSTSVPPPPKKKSRPSLPADTKPKAAPKPRARAPPKPKPAPKPKATTRPRPRNSDRPMRTQKMPDKWLEGAGGEDEDSLFAYSGADEVDDLDNAPSEGEGKRFPVGSFVLAKFPNYGHWPAIILSASIPHLSTVDKIPYLSSRLPESERKSPSISHGFLIQGQADRRGYVVKSIPTGADWRFVKEGDCLPLDAVTGEKLLESNGVGGEEILVGGVDVRSRSHQKYRADLVEALLICGVGGGEAEEGTTAAEASGTERLKEWASTPTSGEEWMIDERDKKRKKKEEERRMWEDA